MRNAPLISFSAKRAAGGFNPVADGNNPGGFWGGQKVFLLHLAKTRDEAKHIAEKLYWLRIEEVSGRPTG